MHTCPLCGSDTAKRLKGILFHDDFASAFVDGERIEFTAKEYRLLKTIYEAGVRGASIGGIGDALYMTDADTPETVDRLIAVLVCRIRKKLKSCRLQVETLPGEWGFGIRHRRYRALILK